MRVFLIGPNKPDWPYEILSHDPVNHTAVIRSKEQVMTDPHFYPKDLKKMGFIITDVVPECFREK